MEHGVRPGVAALMAVVLAFQGCVFVAHRLEVALVDAAEGVQVTSPVKAHLKDGGTVVFARGMTVSGGSMRGDGVRYDSTLAHSQRVAEVSLDSVAAAETFQTVTKGGESLLVSTLATGVGVLAATALAVAIFGSCPTVYSQDEDRPRLEAETFSHSIAPLFEARDVDRLRAQADSAGMVRLEVRNEALETHYINHLQLLEVQHDPGTVVAPEPSGRLLALRGMRPATAVDRTGRDVTATLAEADGQPYRTDAGVLSRVDGSDMEDWVDLTAPVPARAAEAAVALRLKNSLLGTVLFYDVMLAAAGARALDWMGSDLGQISTAVSLGRWYQRRTGLRVSLWRDGAWREMARISDAGPIAWRDVAVALPVPPGESTLRVRLSFTADLWRIDRLSVATVAGRPQSRTLPVERVTADAVPRPDVVERLRRPDLQYLETRPGQRFFADFEAGPLREGATRTFFLSSQGYYTEWIRGDWMRAGGGAPFLPSDDALLVAIRRWRQVQEAMERDFERHRIPVS
jgi:hypothetical protein